MNLIWGYKTGGKQTKTNSRNKIVVRIIERVKTTEDFKNDFCKVL